MPELSRQQIGAAMSKLISAHIGDICVVMSRAAAHKHFSLADIGWKVLPAVLSGQFYVTEAEHKEHGVRAPVAVVTWARVSTEVDAKLTQTAGTPIRLRPEEWTSGEIIWLVDLVGDPRALEGSLRTCADGPFKERVVKMVIRSDGGLPQIRTLHDFIPAPNESENSR